MKLNIISYVIMMSIATPVLALDNPDDTYARRTVATQQAAEKADFSRDADFLQNLLNSLSRIEKECESVVLFANTDKLKNLLYPSDCMRIDADRRLTQFQLKYLTFRDTTNEQVQKETKGFIECQQLIRQLNALYPGVFPQIRINALFITE